MAKPRFEFKLRQISLDTHTLFVTYGKQKFKLQGDGSAKVVTIAPADLGMGEKFTQRLVQSLLSWGTQQGICFKIRRGG